MFLKGGKEIIVPMKSLRGLYRIGPGPSSSHTIGPHLAAMSFLAHSQRQNPDAYRAVFYGSLAYTGIGHSSVESVRAAFAPKPCEVVLDKTTKVEHPLTMKFVALKNGSPVDEATYLSLGGGEVHSDDDPSINEKEIYPFSNFEEIKTYLKENNCANLKDFCLRFEDQSIEDYLLLCTKKMFSCIENGLERTGKIPANSNPRLQLNRVSGDIYRTASGMNHEDGRNTLLMTAYAYSVAESNACGETVVTAPTCGASGIVPAVLYFEHKQRRVPLTKIKDALYVGGIFGNIVKQNSSIAGSVGGCQAEVGTASSMAAAALCFLHGLSLYQTEYAAECAMEHFLGLSCDPVDGYVMIPCIERNGIGAGRAYTSFLYAKSIAPIRTNQVHFDDVVKAMKLTGDSLDEEYKETGLGGLAKVLSPKNC